MSSNSKKKSWLLSLFSLKRPSCKVRHADRQCWEICFFQLKQWIELENNIILHMVKNSLFFMFLNNIRITIITVLDLIRVDFFLTSMCDVFDSWTFFSLYIHIYCVYMCCDISSLISSIELLTFSFLFNSVELFLTQVGGHHVRRTETLKIVYIYIYVNKSSNSDGGSFVLVF